NDELAAEAGISMAMVTTDGFGKPNEAKIWLGHAEAATTRLGVDRDLEHRRLQVAGMIEAGTGNYTAAVADPEKALPVAEATMDKDDPLKFSDVLNLGSTLSKAGAYAKAAQRFEQAIVLREKSVGADHPDIALVLSNLGAAYAHVGEPAKARAAFERSL